MRQPIKRSHLLVNPKKTAPTSPNAKPNPYCCSYYTTWSGYWPTKIWCKLQPNNNQGKDQHIEEQSTHWTHWPTQPFLCATDPWQEETEQQCRVWQHLRLHCRVSKLGFWASVGLFSLSSFSIMFLLFAPLYLRFLLGFSVTDVVLLLNNILSSSLIFHVRFLLLRFCSSPKIQHSLLLL